MLKWDIKSKFSTGKGILGTVRAFAGADKEQRHKTLHRHWQIWVDDINQTLRNALFDNNNNIRKQAQETFFMKHINNLISTSYGPEFSITHKCICKNDEETSKTSIPENIFKEKDSDCFRRARHKELCNNVNCGLMVCKYCEQTISTTDIINQSLKTWKSTVLQGKGAQDNQSDTVIPLSPERLDMAAYLFSYHMNGGCAFEN